MLKKPLAAILTIVIILTLLPATTLGQESEQDLYYNILSDYVDLYNESLDQIMGIIKRIFANERINFNFTKDTGDEVIGVATSKTCEIIEFVPNELENPTMLVYISGDIVDSLLANPSQGAVLEALKEVRIEGVGFFNKIKVSFLNLLIRVSSWFL